MVILNISKLGLKKYNWHIRVIVRFTCSVGTGSSLALYESYAGWKWIQIVKSNLHLFVTVVKLCFIFRTHKFWLILLNFSYYYESHILSTMDYSMEHNIYLQSVVCSMNVYYRWYGKKWLPSNVHYNLVAFGGYVVTG